MRKVDRRIAARVVEWLEEVGSGQEADDEALVVASQCLSEYFNLGEASEPGSRKLVEVFEAGCAALGAQCTMERYERARRDVAGDPGFDEFLAAVSAKGYFDGCEGDEKRARFVKVVDKYCDRRGRYEDSELGTALSVVSRALEERGDAVLVERLASTLLKK